MTLLYKTYLVEYEYINNWHNQTILLLHGWGGNKDSFAKVKKIFNSNYNILSISFPPQNIYQKTYSDSENFNNQNPNHSTIPLDMYDYKSITQNILQLLNLKSIIIICHSFGFRIALLLNTTNICIEKIIITGGAGIQFKQFFLKKLNRQFHTILLKSYPEYFYKFASKEYSELSQIDRKTFKNIINKNLSKYVKILSCPAFLFWGKKDTATPIKILKFIVDNWGIKLIE